MAARRHFEEKNNCRRKTAIY